MSYVIGDPDHVGVHNRLRDDAAALAATMGVDVVLPPPAELGKPGHVDAHNMFAEALAAIAAEATAPIPLCHGGNESDVDVDGVTYRVHVFPADSVLVVERGGTAEVLLVGGGASNSISNWHGMAGDVFRGELTLPTGDLPVSVGAPGDGGGSAPGFYGKPSSLGDLTTAAAGITPWTFPHGSGATPAAMGAGIRSSITGTDDEYARVMPATTRPNHGDGAWTTDGPATAGVVIVRYPAPNTPTLLPAPIPTQTPEETP